MDVGSSDVGPRRLLQPSSIQAGEDPPSTRGLPGTRELPGTPRLLNPSRPA